jgi:hypothetical protein
MRKNVSLAVVLWLSLLGIVGLAFEFGGGGPMVVYIPGGTLYGLKNINIPVVDLPEFTDGIIAFGGYGYGGVPGMTYGGGFGFGGEKDVTKDGKKYKIEVGGGFGGGLKNISFGNVSLLAGVYFGSIDIILGRKVNENNTNVTNLEDGTLEGYLTTSIGYISIAANLAIAVKVTDFMQLEVGTIAIGGYSPDGWLVNGKPLQGLTQYNNFLLTYGFYGGVGFGF